MPDRRHHALSDQLSRNPLPPWPPSIPVDLTEEETRVLAAIVCAVEPHLHLEQTLIVAGFEAKLIRAIDAQVIDLISRYGTGGVERLARRSFNEFPNADAPIDLADGR